MKVLLVGHVCMDMMDDGSYKIGGATFYTGRELQQCGIDVTILTAYGNDFLFADELSNFNVISQSSIKTTIFQNKYIDENRVQYLYDRAADVVLPDLDYDQYDAVIICPICREVSEPFPRNYNGLKIVAGQGFLRDWKESGEVIPYSYDFKDYQDADFLVISEEDMEEEQRRSLNLSEIFEHVIITKGSSGAMVVNKEETIDVKAMDIVPVNLTGAGDVFLGGFIFQFLMSKDVKEALNAGCISAGNHISKP